MAVERKRRVLPYVLSFSLLAGAGTYGVVEGLRERPLSPGHVTAVHAIIVDEARKIGLEPDAVQRSSTELKLRFAKRVPVFRQTDTAIQLLDAVTKRVEEEGRPVKIGTLGLTVGKKGGVVELEARQKSWFRRQWENLKQLF